MKRFYEKNLNCWYGAYMYMYHLPSQCNSFFLSTHANVYNRNEEYKKVWLLKMGKFFSRSSVCLRFFLRIVIHAVEWESNVHTNSASLSQHPYSKGINGDCSHAFLLLSQLNSTLCLTTTAEENETNFCSVCHSKIWILLWCSKQIFLWKYVRETIQTYRKKIFEDYSRRWEEGK